MPLSASVWPDSPVSCRTRSLGGRCRRDGFGAQNCPKKKPGRLAPGADKASLWHHRRFTSLNFCFCTRGTDVREHALLFCLLGLVLTATIILVAAPGAVTWALALIE